MTGRSNMIESKDLGYVAFVLMQPGARLDSYDRTSKLFRVDTDMDKDMISMMYLNSECRKHDSLVIHLKQIIIGG